MFRNRIVVLIVIIGMLMMTLPPMVPDLQFAKGTVTKLGNGDLIVDGSTHTIDMDGAYQHDGNITVKGVNGKLIIRDTIFKFLTPGYQRNIYVKDGGKLILDNSTITVDLDSFNFTESLNIEVTNNGVFDMTDSTLECDGVLKGINGKIYVRNSKITSNIYKIGTSNTCVDIMLTTTSYMLIYDSEINDLPKFGYIDVDGSSEFIAINSFIDIDFKDNEWSRLRLKGSGSAFLYGVTTVKPLAYPPDASAITIASATAHAEIYKWAELNVVDAAGIPVGDAFVSARNFTFAQPMDTPRSEILDYIGKTSETWNVSGIDGLVHFPLKTNNIKYGSPAPAINYTGTYNLTAMVPGFGPKATGGASFTSYPRMLENENLITKNVTFADAVVPPSINKHYSTLTPLVINGNTVLKSPVQIQQNIIIDGGTLTLDSTEMKFDQSENHRFYILVKNGGMLNIKDSELYDRSDIKINIYNYGSTVNVNDSELDDVGALVTRYGGNVNFMAAHLNGNFYSASPDTNVTMMGDTLLNGSMVVMDHANVMLKDTIVNATESISVDDVEIMAVDTHFAQQLTFNGNTKAELINVIIHEATDPIVVEDNAIVYRGWWQTTNVTDGGDNPVAGAMVNVYNYSLPSGDLILYSNGSTGNDGQVVMKVIGEVMTESGTITGLERSYFLEAKYSGLTSSNTGFTAPTKNLKKILKFAEKPDLTPTSVVVMGEPTEGKMLKFNATIENIGSFEARNVLVQFYINDKPMTSDFNIDYLGEGNSTTIEVSWEAQLGAFDLKVAVDAYLKIGEALETNNNKTQKIDISTGAPDIYIHPDNIIFNPTKATKNQEVNITVKVGNIGDTDPRNFDNPVMVSLYIGDPDAGGTQIGNTTVINSIKPFELINVYFEHTFSTLGSFEIYARATTALDSDMTNNFAFTELDVLDFADLTVNIADITFKPSSKVAKDADVTIEVTVANIGESDAKDVHVDFYEGDPDASGILLATEIASVVEGKGGTGSAVVMYKTKFTVEGDHDIYVVIDGPDDIVELNEDNNKANNTLRVLEGPDLAISADEILILSSVPGHIVQDEMVTISAITWNLGETAVSEFEVRFYYNVQTPANLIGMETITGLEPGENVSVQVSWTPSEVGTHRIIVWADPTADITEIDFNNNQDGAWFKIFSKPDLTMDVEDLFTDIKVIPPSVTFSKEVKITATVRNRGESDAGAFWVQFYDGDPALGGVQIGLNKRVNGIKAGQLQAVEVTWNAIPGGQHTIYASIDPFKEVEEDNESNNTMTYEVYVDTVPDLQVMADNIVFIEGDFGRVGKALTVNVTIENTGDIDSDPFTVNFYDGDKVHATSDASYTFIKSVDHDGIMGGESDTVEITWTPDSFGNHRIFVWIDEDGEIFELNDENNYAFKVFEVLEIAADLMLDPDDIRITQNGVSASKYKTQTAYQFNVTIHNAGNEAVSEFFVYIGWEDPSGATGMLGDQEHSVAGLDIDSEAYVSVDWMPTMVGTYKFTVMVDSTELYREFNEENNSLAEPASFVVTQKPDFKIAEPNIDITILPIDARAGDEITITVTVTATGDLDLNSVTLNLTVDGNPIFTNTKALEGDPLTATFATTYVHDYEGIPKFLFTIDPLNTEAEIDEKNNEVSWENLFVGAKKSEPKDESFLSSPMFLILIIIIVVVVVVVVMIMMKKRKKKKKPIECAECGTMVDPGLTECPECGAEIVVPPELVECKNCGAEITTEDETCPECGEANEAFVPPEEGLGLRPEEGAAAPEAAPAPVPAPAAAPAPKAKKEKKKKAAAAAAGPAPGPTPAPPVPKPAPGGQETEMGELDGLEDMLTEEGEGEAECYKCGARVPLSVPKCPVCGADFE